MTGPWRVFLHAKGQAPMPPEPGGSLGTIWRCWEHKEWSGHTHGTPEAVVRTFTLVGEVVVKDPGREGCLLRIYREVG